MERYENECRGCSTDGYPCDRYCRYKRVKHIYCDYCGAEHEGRDAKIYWYDGKQLCLECIEELLEEVK
jgi:hypothetical protein